MTGHSILRFSGFRAPQCVDFNEIIVAVWISSSFYIMYATGGQIVSFLFLPLVLGAIVLVLMTAGKKVVATVPPIMSLGVFVLNAAILASYFFNADIYDLTFMVGNTLSSFLLFFSLYLVTMKINLDFRKVLLWQSILTIGLLPVILVTSTRVWGRLQPGLLHPNYVGMSALLCFFGALAARNLWVALGLGLLPLYTIVAMQSRTSLLAATLAFAIVIGWQLKQRLTRRLLGLLSLLLLTAGATAIVLVFAGVPLFDFSDRIVDRLLILSDAHRGLSSGASGRTDLWSAAVDLWLGHPLFGVGFKGHQMQMPDQMLAHNAYLGVLADVGLVGFTGYLLIIVTTLYYIIKRRHGELREYSLRAAIIFSYVVYGMLESRAFSFGNAYSILFMLVAFDSSRTTLTAPGPQPWAAFPINGNTGVIANPNL